ncbi:MAG: hypothetical protein Kow00129_08800 [Thermoleophilia bacterium]
MDAEAIRVEGPITVGQLLKLAGLVSTGGEAKLLIMSGEVLVNGVVETRRGRRLARGDVVEVGGRSVRLAEGDDHSASSPASERP